MKCGQRGRGGWCATRRRGCVALRFQIRTLLLLQSSVVANVRTKRELYRESNIFSGMANRILSYFVSNLVVILMYVNFFAICFLCKQEIQFVKQDCGYRKQRETAKKARNGYAMKLLPFGQRSAHKILIYLRRCCEFSITNR